MRLRTLVAPDMPRAMMLLRREMGDDAIIVSTETTGDGVKIIAAIEEAEPAELSGSDLNRAAPGGAASDSHGDVVDTVHEALLGHGLPARLIERLVDASFLTASDDANVALTGALSAIFSFRPLDQTKTIQPMMLIGTPGAGKTMTAVKFAARYVMSGHRIRLITTDTIRAGAFEQLGAFARLLGIPLLSAETPSDLANAVRSTAPGEQIVIDTAGINPRAPGELHELAELIDAGRCEPVLVVGAGGDIVEAMEQSAAMTELGAGRLVATKIDTIRRLGGVLAAADAGQLALAEYGFSSSVANGLAPFDARNLSRMLMPDAIAAAKATVVGGR